MDDRLFDDVPITNKARDKAWEAFIKRKSSAALFSDKEFGFPLNGGFYAMWCICWAKAWDAGFNKGVESKPEVWVGLTDEEIDEKTDFRATVRYFEAKLKEKNT
jgi:hypothetical protein